MVEMRLQPATLVLVFGLVLGASGCKDDTPTPVSGPAPVPLDPRVDPRAPTAPAPNEAGEIDDDPEASKPARVLGERPPADPAIERALELIGNSGLRFIDVPNDPDKAPTEYTAKQFASMLRTKWDWLGYDLTELKPWLDEIATRSFKTNLPYQVLLADGSATELRSWLDAQLAQQPPP